MTNNNTHRTTAMTWVAIAGAVVVIALLFAVILPFLSGAPVAQDTEDQQLGVGGPEEGLITDPLTIIGQDIDPTELEGRQVLLTDMRVLQRVGDQAFFIMTSQGDILVVMDAELSSQIQNLETDQRVNIEGTVETLPLEQNVRSAFENRENLLEDRTLFIRAHNVDIIQEQDAGETTSATRGV